MAKKKTAKKRPVAKALDRDRLTQYQTVLALRATIRDRDALLLALTSPKIGLDLAAADEMINRATGDLLEAANYCQGEELGRALARAHQLYAKSESIQDYKACLSIQKEINKLLDLYPRASSPGNQVSGTGTTEAEAELDRIRRYLEPLQLAPAGTPPAELVRLAIERILGG